MKSINDKLTKTKIKRMVDLYKVLHKIEYDKTVKYVALKRDAMKDEGRVDSDIIKRALMEYPERLLDMIENGTEPDEYKWFRSIDGAKYFAKLCPEFLLISKI